MTETGDGLLVRLSGETVDCLWAAGTPGVDIGEQVRALSRLRYSLQRDIHAAANGLYGSLDHCTHHDDHHLAGQVTCRYCIATAPSDSTTRGDPLVRTAEYLAEHADGDQWL